MQYDSSAHSRIYLCAMILLLFTGLFVAGCSSEPKPATPAKVVQGSPGATNANTATARSPAERFRSIRSRPSQSQP